MTVHRRERTGAEPTLDDGDVALGRRTKTRVLRANLLAVVVAVLMAVFVVTQVPLSTTASYARLSQQWQLPLGVLVVVPLVLLPPYFSTRKSDGASMTPTARRQLLIAAPAFLVVMLVAQALMSWGFLSSAGVV